MTPIKLALAATLFLTIASCGSDSPGYGRCLTDADVCQFQDGVSTKQQVSAALGKPYLTQSISNGGTTIEQWAYVCMPDKDSIQQVQFVFDGNGVLMAHLAQSTGNAPVVTCPP